MLQNKDNSQTGKGTKAVTEPFEPDYRTDERHWKNVGGKPLLRRFLTQVAAVESALQSFGYVILQEHMETCVVEEIKRGNEQIVDEAVELIKKLK